MKISSGIANGLLVAASLAVVARSDEPSPPAGDRKLLGTSFGATALNPFHVSTNSTFDYVVVGGGTAGIPMGVRLAEAGYSVAIIEGGNFYETQNSNLSQIPLYCVAFGGGAPPGPIASLIDWGFTTTPQAGEDGRVSYYTRGKTLGGSSARNYQAFHFGTAGSYQEWADEVDDQTYTFDQFQTFLHKPLNFTPPVPDRPANATPQYAPDLNQDKDGPLSVTFGTYAWPFSPYARDAMTQAGLDERHDGLTTGALNGSSYVLLTVDGTAFERESSETGYLRKLGLANNHLITYTNTLATKILFDASKKATGIEADMGGVNLTISARKEVIVSAGVFQSPQLLMVSGVGPSEELDKFNIPVISDLAGVGQGMRDHVLGAINRRVNVFTPGRMTNDVALQEQLTDEYLANPPRGPLTTFSADVFAFEKLPPSYRDKLSNATQQGLAALPADWPEVEYLINSGYNGPNLPGFLGSPDGKDWASISAALVAPFSRGNVTLRSSDMRDKPVINPGWLSDPRDQEVAVQAFRRIQAFFNQTAMQPVLASDGGQYPPAADLVTDEQVLNVIRQGFGSVLHASCTARMGKKGDPMAVSDSQARVYGVQGLRVVDASAFPLLPPGMPQATVCKYLSLFPDLLPQHCADRPAIQMA